MLNKVPEVTLYFWLIKCLCTTIGETESDNLTTGWAGGDNASVHALDSAALKVMLVTIGVLVVLLAIQFTRRKYVAVVYWANIVVISVVGTQITDQFEGNGDQPHHMWAITIVSVILLAARVPRLVARRAHTVDALDPDASPRDCSTGSRSSSPSRPAPPSAT